MNTFQRTLLATLGALALDAHAAPGPFFDVSARTGFVQDEGDIADGHAEVSTDLGYFQGSASADLLTGILRAQASASTTQTGTCNPAAPADCQWGSGSRAYLIDTVTLHRSATTPEQQTTRIDWQWDIDGQRTQGPFNGQTSAMAYAYVGDSAEALSAAPGINLGNVDQIKGTIEFDTEEYTVYIYGFIDLIARNGATADYGHTMKFSWALPQNVSYTSQSGLFLQGAAPVPEPQTGALMLAGLGLMGWQLKRRGQARQG